MCGRPFLEQLTAVLLDLGRTTRQRRHRGGQLCDLPVAVEGEPVQREGGEPLGVRACEKIALRVDHRLELHRDSGVK